MTLRACAARRAVTASVPAFGVAGVGGRRRAMRGLRFPLGDVGDGWRALLFGAPPLFR